MHRQEESVGRALLTAVTVSLVLICPTATRSAPPGADVERVVSEIKKLGGRVETKEDGTRKRAVLVYLNDSRITDEFLQKLTVLENVKGLDLSGTRITDAGMARLAGL